MFQGEIFGAESKVCDIDQSNEEHLVFWEVLLQYHITWMSLLLYPVWKGINDSNDYCIIIQCQCIQTGQCRTCSLLYVTEYDLIDMLGL